MASTPPDITIGRDGRFFIDKRYRGIRIGIRSALANRDRAH